MPVGSTSPGTARTAAPSCGRPSSPNRDFRDSTWTSQPLEGAGSVTVNVEAPPQGWIAYYVEVKFEGDLDTPFGNCTQMTVLPETFPTQGRAL